MSRPLATCESEWSSSCSVVSYSLRPHGLHSPWNSPGHNTGVGSLSLLQGIFPAQVSNPGLLHCWQILYQLSHKGSPGILAWAAYPFSSGSSQPSNQTRSPALQVDSLPTELSGKALPCFGFNLCAVLFYFALLLCEEKHKVSVAVVYSD